MSKVTNCNLTCPPGGWILSSINAINSKLTAGILLDMPPTCENSTFKATSIEFSNYNVSGNSATLKGCKFETLDNKPHALVVLPYQTANRTSFNFTFDTCDFGKGFMFEVSYEGSKPWLDKDGKLITKLYCWYELNDDGTFKKDDENRTFCNRRTC